MGSHRNSIQSIRTGTWNQWKWRYLRLYDHSNAEPFGTRICQASGSQLCLYIGMSWRLNYDALTSVSKASVFGWGWVCALRFLKLPRWFFPGVVSIEHHQLGSQSMLFVCFLKQFILPRFLKSVYWTPPLNFNQIPKLLEVRYHTILTYYFLIVPRTGVYP